MKHTKYLLIIITALAVLSQVVTINASSYEEHKTLDIDQLPFKQEIKIPIDTSLTTSKNQPIDIRIVFSNPCWAEDENTHSVRVCYDDGKDLNEIESQIYDLEKNDEPHISSCSIVFLIPGEADGKEKYYVLYDSSETKPADYEDHLVTYDTHYFYEPIPGQRIDFDYYGIKQGDEVIYGIVQKGELLGNPIAQNIVKLKPGSKEVETYNFDQLAGFDIRYGKNEAPGYYGTSCATQVEKKVLVDGNLMARFWVKCNSPDNTLHTENIYTYYYSPGITKKIWVNIHHEILETINIEDPSVYDGTLCGIVSIKSRSATIQKMNVGEILPEINLFSESGVIETFDVPTNPSSNIKEKVLSVEDDMDLGEKVWMCLHNPETGKTHGLILDSNTGFSEDNDGVQVKAWVEQNIKLPGLEADTGNMFMTKNSYEKETGHDTVLKKDAVYDYNVEFINLETKDLEEINIESEIFQNILKTRPLSKENESDEDNQETSRYSLTAYVHLAPSMPMGSLLSAALGKSIPYISAELYKDNRFKSSGAASRLPLAVMEKDLKGKKLVEKIKTITGIFDWRNASFFKKITFPDLEPGKYVIKIFKENPLFKKERQYIGFTIVEIKDKDSSSHIYCKPQGSITISVLDQNNKGVENVQLLLLQDDTIISDNFSDKNGSTTLKAPCINSKPYTLKLIYQGFLVNEKEITLSLKNHYKELKEQFTVEQYVLNLKLEDKWGFTPAVEVNPRLTSSEMITPMYIPGEKTGDGEYQFTCIYPSEYALCMNYKSFDIQEPVSIDKDVSLDFVFPALYKLELDVMNSYGEHISKGLVSISRNGKNEAQDINENGKAVFTIPPGEYQIIIKSDENEIAKQKIQVRGDKQIDIVSSEGSLLHTIAVILGIILAICSVIILLWKRKIFVGIRLLAIAMLIIALFSPWWVLNGDDGTTSTTTNTMLIPAKIVTVTTSSNVIGGDVSQVPAEVTMVLGLLSMLVAVTILLVILSIFSKNKLRKTTIILSILSIILLIATAAIFFYAMSQLTGIGVGSFNGSGDLETTIPGIEENEVLTCNWGPGIGFYLGIIAVICLVITMFHKKIEKCFSKDN